MPFVGAQVLDERHELVRGLDHPGLRGGLVRVLLEKPAQPHPGILVQEAEKPLGGFGLVVLLGGIVAPVGVHIPGIKLGKIVHQGQFQDPPEIHGAQLILEQNQEQGQMPGVLGVAFLPARRGSGAGPQTGFELLGLIDERQ